MIRTKLLLAGALALMVTLSGSSAYAQEPANQITYFTFSAPFELPGGKVLPAGKYVFKIVDSPSNRHVVQIMSEDQKTMHATLLAIPAQRQEPPSEPEVRFMETAANMPPAVRTWWYPGRSIGHEFIYPKDHARRLAARQTEAVLTVASDATTTEQMRSADLSRINASGQETAAQMRADSAARTATSAQTTRPATRADASLQSTPTESTTPTATTAPATRASAETRRTALPTTATLLPLIGLIGLASLLGAGMLRARRR
jgi:hypothetical protein